MLFSNLILAWTPLGGSVFYDLLPYEAKALLQVYIIIFLGFVLWSGVIILQRHRFVKKLKRATLLQFRDDSSYTEEELVDRLITRTHFNWEKIRHGLYELKHKGLLSYSSCPGTYPQPIISITEQGREEAEDIRE